MLKFVKFLAVCLILLVDAGVAQAIFVMSTTAWVQHASFITVGLTVLGALLLGYLSFHAIKRIVKL